MSQAQLMKNGLYFRTYRRIQGVPAVLSVIIFFHAITLHVQNKKYPRGIFYTRWIWLLCNVLVLDLHNIFACVWPAEICFMSYTKAMFSLQEVLVVQSSHKVSKDVEYKKLCFDSEWEIHGALFPRGLFWFSVHKLVVTARPVASDRICSWAN